MGSISQHQFGCERLESWPEFERHGEENHRELKRGLYFLHKQWEHGYVIHKETCSTMKNKME
jgi:hypothetical protein